MLSHGGQWDITRLLGRWRNLKHKGAIHGERVKHATLTSLKCGDRISIYLIADDKGAISDIKFSALSGVTCAVVADLLIDRILENNLMVGDVVSMDIQMFLESIGMVVSPSKMQSAKLPLQALQKALDE